MSALGGIGQQVACDLFELGKGAAKATVKTVTDVAGDSLEQILNAPLGAIKNDLSKNNSSNQDGNADQEKLIKKREEKKQFNEVKSELAEYIERKRQQDSQIAREKAEEKQVTEQKKGMEKQKKETFLQKLMSQLARGSHGETDRQKE